MQIIDYNEILDLLKDQLTAANTTSAAYDLSSDLDSRINTITRDDLKIIPEMKAQYPMVSVRAATKNEEDPAGIAAGNWNKLIDLNYEITCVYDSYSEAEDNLWNMVRNIEANLRYNKSINNYNELGFKFVYILPESVEFISHINEPTDFNKSAIINVLIRGHLKDS